MSKKHFREAGDKTLYSVSQTAVVNAPPDLITKSPFADIGEDVYFYVSGSIDGHDAIDRHVSVFGGDVVISGSLCVQGGEMTGDFKFDCNTLELTGSIDVDGNGIFKTGMTGSLTQLPDGTSYLIAGENINIVTGTKGNITISVDQNMIINSLHSNADLSLSATDNLLLSANGGTYSLATPTDVTNYPAVFGNSSLVGAVLEAKSEGYAYYRKGYLLAGNIDINGNLDITSVGTMRPGWSDERDIDIYVNGVLQHRHHSENLASDFYMVDDHTIHFNDYENFTSDEVVTIIVKNSNGAPFGTGYIPPPAVTMVGDVIGDSNSSTVARIRSRTVSSVAPNDGDVYAWNFAANQWVPTAISAASGTPGGTNSQIQFNDNDSFGGDAQLTYDKTTDTLSGIVIKASTGFSGSLTRLTDGKSYLIASSSSTCSQTGSISITTGSNGQVTISSYVFPDNLTVSLSGGKTFGRYASGDVIPAKGKTPAEVILMAIAEPINPTVSLSSATTIQFNQTTISNILNFSYVINSLGASISSVALDWRRNNSGGWTSLSTNTGLTTYTHSYSDSSYNAQPFNYRYRATDSQGASSIATFNITPSAYVSPSFSLSIAASSITSPETNTKREKGNVSTVIGGTITKNSPLVTMTHYSVQYQINGAGSWINVPGLSSVVISGNPSSVIIPSTIHNDVSLKSSDNIAYRIQVTDGYQTTNSSSVAVDFINIIFYGSSASKPTTSSDIRNLDNRVFADRTSNPLTLDTGTANKIFTVAMPSSLSLTSVIDLTALNADITSNYILSTFNVNDAGNTSTSYHVYTLTNATPYGVTHQHRVTRA